MSINRPIPSHFHVSSGLPWTGHTHGVHYFYRFIRSVRALLIRKKLCTHTSSKCESNWEHILQGGKYEVQSMQQIVIQPLVWDCQLKNACFKEELCSLFRMLIVCLEKSKSQTDSCWCNRQKRKGHLKKKILALWILEHHRRHTLAWQKEA